MESESPKIDNSESVCRCTEIFGLRCNKPKPSVSRFSGCLNRIENKPKTDNTFKNTESESSNIINEMTYQPVHNYLP